MQLNRDFRDFLGHGTAVAGVIRAKAPDAELYAVKVFDEHLWTLARLLAAAIRWGADQGMRVVNLSLGTTVREHRDLLGQVCGDAARKGVILVAAGEIAGREIFPAALPNVIGVAGDERCGWDEYYLCEGESVLFRAHPWPRPLPRLPQKYNLHGHSFAAAHISGLVARIVEQWPTADYAEVKKLLIANATHRLTQTAESESQKSNSSETFRLSSLH